MAAAEEKMSFILYGSYEEQLNMLTDEQAGKWIKAIYAYVRTGEKHSDDPLVAMLLSVAGYQLDIDARKYAEKKERLKEAARKAGKASAEKRAMKKTEETQRNATVVNDCQRLQPVIVDDDVNVDVDVDEYVDADADVLDNKTGRRRQEEEEDACAREEGTFMNIFVDKSVDNCMDNQKEKQRNTEFRCFSRNLLQYFAMVICSYPLSYRKQNLWLACSVRHTESFFSPCNRLHNRFHGLSAGLCQLSGSCLTLIRWPLRI